MLGSLFRSLYFYGYILTYASWYRVLPMLGACLSSGRNLEYDRCQLFLALTQRSQTVSPRLKETPAVEEGGGAASSVQQPH